MQFPIVEDQRLPVTNPDAPMQVFGSDDGWLSFKDDGGADFYLVPVQTYEKMGKVVRMKDIAKTWYHLGDFILVES